MIRSLGPAKKFTQVFQRLLRAALWHLRILTKRGLWTTRHDGVSVLVRCWPEGGCEPVETRKTTVRPWEIDDELWARIEPLLPVVARNPRRPGRKRRGSRKVPCGILYLLYPGIRWEFLPRSWASARR
ncbi:transposase [Streptomyces incarnatus]|uniref:transposase n=1 Tax=Streptomyces incarnatus TaxID=665007 RepID=UPI003CC6864E